MFPLAIILIFPFTTFFRSKVLQISSHWSTLEGLIFRHFQFFHLLIRTSGRSEERRVGKEWTLEPTMALAFRSEVQWRRTGQKPAKFGGPLWGQVFCHTP